MITIIGDTGIYSPNPVLLGIKSLFERKSQMETQILTPSLNFKRNALAEANGVLPGSIWSVFDFFTGRMEVAERRIGVEDFETIDGYEPEKTPVPTKFFREDGARIELETGRQGSISFVNSFDVDGKLNRRFIYDDGGYLSCLEIPETDDEKNKVQMLFSPDGKKIFELEIVRNRISKVHYIPENLRFDNLDDFYSWAFMRLVSKKGPKDKVFVGQENFRRSILHAEFNPAGVYLIADTLTSGVQSRDILYDHFEKVVFNVKSDQEAVAEKFEEKIGTQLVWNNFAAPGKIIRDFSAPPQLYFYIGHESEEVKFDILIEVFTDLLNFIPDLRLALHFSRAYDHSTIVEKLNEEHRERITALARPLPQKMLEEVKKTDIYIYVSKPEAVPPVSLNDAIAAKIPILKVLGHPAIDTFVNADNGRSVGYEQLSTVIKRALTLPVGYFELADDPEKVREYFSPEATMARWMEIFKQEG